MTKLWLPIRPKIPCPDCSGMMELQHKPTGWAGPNPFVYLCEDAPRCPGLLSAHPNGDPVGEAVPKTVRQARRHCHEIFDPLWLAAPSIYEIAEQGSARTKAIAIIRRTARKRAYEYLADRLGLTVADCHIGKITDLDMLRRFYRHARELTPQAIRDWAKARRLEKAA